MRHSRSMISGDQYLGGLFMFFWRAVRKHLLLALILPLAAMAVGYFAALQLPPSMWRKALFGSGGWMERKP